MCQYIAENKIFYSKEFAFQKGQSTEHAVVQLVYQIVESFVYSKCTLGVFIDLSKAFNIVYHSVLFKKLKLYCVTDRNHS